MGSPWGNNETVLFSSLDQDIILSSVEMLGLKPSGRVLPLNSMENRVLEIELDERPDYLSNDFVVAKFYRPGRWSKEQIKDEHRFLLDLKEHEISVISPLVFDGETVFEDPKTNLFFCLYPKKGGRLKAELLQPDLEKIGRLLARVHMVGTATKASHRLTLDSETFGKSGQQILLNSPQMPERIKESYTTITNQLFDQMRNGIDLLPKQRIHGDCHLGNILWQEELPFLVDFDDMYNGPIVQDVWLFLPQKHEDPKGYDAFFEAYDSMNEFPYNQLRHIDSLRALRMIHFNAWLAKRWHDPAFQRTFPQFSTERYWDEHYNDMREILAKIIESQNYYY
jgi:Ser/Thr protein kinase RdoA (MazF antagonist)